MSASTGEKSRTGSFSTFVVNTVLMLAGIFNLLWGCYQAFLGDQSLAITCLTAGLLLVLASTIDRFELLKGFGIEAKTRALDKALTDADVMLTQIRHLAEITSRSIVALTSGAGRVGSAPSIRSNMALIDEVRGTLQKLHSDPDKIRAMLLPWVRVTLFDAMQPIVGKVREALTAVQQAANAEAMSLPRGSPEQAACRARATAAADFNRDRVGNPGAWPVDTVNTRLAQIVAEMPLLSEQTREELRREVETWGPRFTHLVVHQELLQPESWFALQPDR